MSLPIPIGEQFAANNPASPPELPPTVLRRFHIFYARPHKKLFV